MTKKRILIVEDDENIQELLEYNLTREGFQITIVASGEEALRSVSAKQVDLVILDLMLPGMDGLEVCRLLKANPASQHIPVVILTAKGEESDVVVGLELGADDYIAKPFSPKILLARIRAVLRRKAREESGDTAVLARGDLVIDPARYTLTVRGKGVDLTATEFGLLHFLARKPGWVFTRQQIVDAVKGEDYAVTERSVDVQIVGLRKKLGPSADCIETVRGIGYRFRE